MKPERGDVVRSLDPFKIGTDKQRPWLVLSTDRHPFGDEQVIAVAVTRRAHDRAYQLSDDVWMVGGVPEDSYVAPWAVHSPRVEDLVAWQGRVVSDLVDRIADDLFAYVSE